MFKSIQWHAVLWTVVAVAVAGCSVPATVAVPQLEPTLAPTPMLATPQGGPFPSPRPTDPLSAPPSHHPLPASPLVTRVADRGWRHYWRPSGKPLQIRDLAVGGEWLWIATPQGLARVNQHTLAYEQFSHTGTSPDVPLDGLTTLLVDDQGRLWAGGQDGLVRYDDDSGWTIITTTRAYGFGLDARDNVWLLIYSRSGASGFRFQGQEPPANGNWEPEAVTEIPRRDDCEAWRFMAATWLRYNSQAECTASPDKRTARAASGADWSSGEGREILIRRDGKTVRSIPESWSSVRAIVAAGVKDGVWIGLEEGLFHGKDRAVREYLDVGRELVPWEPEVRAFAFTGDGHAWASTSNGLFRLDKEREEWQPVATGETISAGGSAPIAADDQGGLWVLGDDALARFDGQTWQRWSLPFAMQQYDWKSRAIAAFRGEIWVAAGVCCFWRFDGKTWERSTVNTGIATFTQGLDGKLYTTSDYGFIYVYDGARWTELLASEGRDGFGHNRPVIAVDADGGIMRAWAGYETRLWRYIPGEKWDNPLPLPTDFIVTSLLVDSQDNLWVGGYPGLLRCNDQVCESLTFGDAWSGPFVDALAQDRQGRIWVGGRGWLSVYDPTVGE